VLPNGIDPSVYRPLPRQLSREALGLPQDRRLILFGALGRAEAHRKGVAYLEAALRHLARHAVHQDLMLVIIGASWPDAAAGLGIEARYLGRLHDDISLALAYSAADVFVAPSTQDNLPNTVMEALACGTPCVAFDIGGMPDMIEHQVNGYLARAFSSEDLATGIAWVLADAGRWRDLSACARTKVEAEFDVREVARRYVRVYEEALSDSRSDRRSD
jgi:glycosyltransferase involved in cell wall biosynthesis